MNSKLWHKLLVIFALPAVLFFYYNQSANWHYHITENGFIVEHAHPFTNNTLPGTPFQDHEHSDAEYLFLAEMMHSLGLALVVLLLLGLLLHSRKRSSVLPIPVFLPDNGTQPIIPRGPPQHIA
ncbi:MAG: hypothetical protein RG741_05565 [Bacteroidales bacterium]|nr:hypothetical protein [Bacteroidales bacterium]